VRLKLYYRSNLSSWRIKTANVYISLALFLSVLKLLEIIFAVALHARPVAMLHV